MVGYVLAAGVGHLGLLDGLHHLGHDSLDEVRRHLLQRLGVARPLALQRPRPGARPAPAPTRLRAAAARGVLPATTVMFSCFIFLSQPNCFYLLCVEFKIQYKHWISKLSTVSLHSLIQVQCAKYSTIRFVRLIVH